MARKKMFILLALSVLVIITLVTWIAWGNTVLELNTYTVKSSRLSENFDGFRIAHISDLHNTQIGEDNKTLLNIISDAEPDIIAITGDLIDSRNTDIDIALEFIQQALKIAPCYYVTGNHEARVAVYDELKKGMESAGVIILEDATAKINIADDTLTLIGVDDPSFQTDYMSGDSATLMSTKLMELHKNKYDFTILLSHRPELFEIYADNDIDLVFSGHAHGGQFRLPFFGGVIAPNQGLFPEFDSGIYTQGNTNMLVSRGVGNSILPFRINNRPEVILVELNSDFKMNVTICDEVT